MMLVSKSAHRCALDPSIWRRKIAKYLLLIFLVICWTFIDVISNRKGSLNIELDQHLPEGLTWRKLYYLIQAKKVHNRGCSRCRLFPISGTFRIHHFEISFIGLSLVSRTIYIYIYICILSYHDFIHWFLYFLRLIIFWIRSHVQVLPLRKLLPLRGLSHSCVCACQRRHSRNRSFVREGQHHLMDAFTCMLNMFCDTHIILFFAMQVRHPDAASASMLYYQFPTSKCKQRTHAATCADCGASTLTGSKYVLNAFVQLFQAYAHAHAHAHAYAQAQAHSHARTNAHVFTS